jgi:alpha-1,2-mannosyltransferase
VLLAVLVPVMMFSSITVTLTLTGTVSGEGPLPLRLFTGLGVVLPVALLVVWASLPARSTPTAPPAHPVRATAGPPTRA